MDPANRLKWTLLATLGWSAIACGGEAREIADDDGGGGSTHTTGGTSGGGETSTGGSISSGGSAEGGSSTGGASMAGAPATGGTGASSGGQDGSGGTGASRVPCSNPVELETDDGLTGFVQCEEGYRHRPRTVTCENNLDPQAGPEGVDGITPDTDECEVNADCAGEKQHCALTGEQIISRECVQGCTEDADCGDNMVCECGKLIGKCVPSTCTTNADCGEGELCASDDNPSCGSVQRFACTSVDDACMTMNDCAEAGGYEGCSAATGTRTCEPVAVCGRPFLVKGESRTAEMAFESKLPADESDAPPLTEEECRRVQEHFVRAAQMEHASVAAFARFTLQLMSVGAPLDLIEESTRAQADEARHARQCQVLAERYGATDVQFGALELKDALADIDFEEVLKLCVIEGCIGESTAALEATEAALGASDPKVAAELRAIADDELRHAALAFRFAAWALSVRPDLGERVETWFHVHSRGMGAASISATAKTREEENASARRLRACGVLSPGDVREVARRAESEIIAPCREALFHQVRASSVTQKQALKVGAHA